MTFQDMKLRAAPERWRWSIRALAPADVGLFRDHLLRLSTECRRSRFGCRVSDTFLRTYVERVDFANTLVLGCFVAGAMVGACELRSPEAAWAKDAELAFSVEKAWRSRGLGTALMAQVIEAARALPVEHLYLTCSAENRPMQQIARRAAATLTFADGDCIGQIVLSPGPATAGRVAA